VAGDGLAWFGDADAIAAPALAPLLSTGAQAGLATVLSTVSAPAAGQLAALANVLVIRGPADTSLAGGDPAATVLAGTTLDDTVLAGDQFTLVIRGPQQQCGAGAVRTGQAAMTPRQADRVYLGWEYAVLHPHPGPPPRRPVPPGQERLDPGWVAAQQREERRLSLPLKAGAAASAGLAALSGALGAASVLTPALTTTGVVACLAVTVCGVHAASGVAPGNSANRVAAEDQRVARAQAAQERRLAGWQEEHAQRFRDWEARGGSSRPSGSGTGWPCPPGSTGSTSPAARSPGGRR